VAGGRRLVASFARLRFEWVPAHAGIADNERCDRLAREAIKRGTAP
jgi:ribonuclease HI